MKRAGKVSKLETIEGTVAELSPGGDGVLLIDAATHDGRTERRAVFVPKVALSERVRVTADFSKRPARGRLVDVLVRSDDRVEPACPDLDRCGACDWMHLSGTAQTAGHAAIVERSLPSQLRHDAPAVRSHAAVEPWGYRARARVHVDAYRGKITVGMYGKGTHAPVAVASCAVLSPALEDARRSLPALFAGADGRGEVQLALGAPRAGSERRRAVLEIQWTGKLPIEIFARLERAVTEGSLAGARVFDGPVTVPAIIGDPTPWLTAADGAPLKLAPGGFSQATEAGNDVLARRAAELARELTPPDGTIVELYAGAGNLTVLLAPDRNVIAVEKGRDACDAARENLRARGLHAKVVDADATTFPIPKCKLVVLDPPRTGARDVCTSLARRPVPAVVYVSCDPATLGRDLAILGDGGYVLRSLETFEMFPQTSHVESVAVLVHARASKAPATNGS